MKMTTKIQLFEFLYETCQQDNGFLADTLNNYIDTLSEQELAELEACRQFVRLTNPDLFGDD